MCEMFCQIVQKKQEEKRIEEEQAASALYWNILAYCDDDDDYDSAITLVLSTEEPIDSLNEEFVDELLTSYLHRSMIVSTFGICPIRVS
uniref:Uncharacterized protein n=1 Tax=Tanacetum cinerariifolium TaxID=118510 RepID=A0A699SKT6_TANCI|nr:hypothetical protein [Tanacetum cinerariifolium]